MKTTIVIYGSSTGSCQSIAETIASQLGVEAVDVANIDDACGLTILVDHFLSYL